MSEPAHNLGPDNKPRVFEWPLHGPGSVLASHPMDTTASCGIKCCHLDTTRYYKKCLNAS